MRVWPVARSIFNAPPVRVDGRCASRISNHLHRYCRWFCLACITLWLALRAPWRDTTQRVDYQYPYFEPRAQRYTGLATDDWKNALTRALCAQQPQSSRARSAQRLQAPDYVKYYKTCCPLVRFSPEAASKMPCIAARDGPCTHGKVK